jgi:tetratricopeptide (TPR) repeat protein
VVIATSEYDAELRCLDEDVAALEVDASAGRFDVVKATALASGRYRRATLAGDLAALDAVEGAIDAAMAQFGPWPDLCVLKASVASTLHRVADARQALELAPGVIQHQPGRAMLADLDREEGRYEDALRGYEDALRDEPTWDTLARLADLTFKLGDADAAEDLYIAAVDELTAKQMRSYAWVELQWGRMDLSRGRHDHAAEHYARAGAAYSGYWLVDEHVAQLLAARGELEAAVMLYENVAARVPKPELQQAVGDVYVALAQPDRARPWHDRALAAYLESAGRGEVHYFHHLVDFYTEVRVDGPEAIRWARKDLELRSNAFTRAALAWALYRAERMDESLDAIAAALKSGLRDVNLFTKAATIERAAGRLAEADLHQRRADALGAHRPAAHAHHH